MSNCLPPVNIDDLDPNSPIILSSPFISPLLFTNDASDARDHCANERNFLSWLRLSVYLCVVSIAIVISFHFKREPTQLERSMSMPLGIIFWALSLACLFAGLANYLKTIQLYRRKTALVQSGAKTQVVLGIITVVIIATCLLFLTTNAKTR
ncbi:uncharacterized protein LAJ45_00461 [Morchella importuna]|uniref:DUF202 domain-containing protein n=1 Tax=Morchella conica CCBAS932 TaxID=1392247 RepID=A0A3N4KJ26_9PEZI|nr:uncharacterized protein LAJ45_00461 [Morchella importuna]KAH8155451.1 hypothetical protein LAJ45_00461 [Morchella importuna]RPB10520.1 hypothetical protein P167DRAFT_537446 [Morchella conica CCBAS932]